MAEQRARRDLAGRVARWALLAAALFCLVVGLQVQQGAYRSDFGGHPDEAAHVVTTLMVRDYLVEGLPGGRSPLGYAEEYYENFPKVALGHYPPGFYGLGALWMLPQREGWSVLFFCAAVTSCMGLVMAGVVLGLGGRWVGGVGVAVIYSTLPVIRQHTGVVMADVLLGLFCLLATLAFARHLETRRAGWSLAFGLLAAAAILTKASGLSLAPMVVIALILTRRAGDLLTWRLWLGALPVLGLALPWMALTAGITSEGLMDILWVDYLLTAPGYFLGQWQRIAGWVFSAVLLAAFWDRVRAAADGGKSEGSVRPCLAALVLAVPLLSCLIPSGLEGRYLLPAVAPALILAVDVIGRAGRALAGWLSSRTGTVRGGVVEGVGACAVVVFCVLVWWERHEIRVKEFSGAGEAVLRVLERDVGGEGEGEGRLVLLVISDARGEGALIAAGAFAGRERLRIHRGSKELAALDWMGRGEASIFESGAEVLEHLFELGIGAVVLDSSLPVEDRFSFHGQVEEVLGENGSGFVLWRRVDARRDGREGGEIEIWVRDGG
jgi:hypothetical protein